MSPKESMKEETFTAEDLGLDGEITAVRYDSDNTVTVEYVNGWQRLLKEVEERLDDGVIMDDSQCHRYIDLKIEECSFKFGNWMLTDYRIDTMAHFGDDDDLHGVLRVWFDRKA